MTGKNKRETVAEAATRWRDRGRQDAKMRKKPHEIDTLRAVGGDVAVRAYMEGYNEKAKP